MEGVHLHFTSEAIGAVADKAIELKTGARALRSIMERIMLNVMYDLPQVQNVDEVVINRPVVEGRGKPRIKYKKAIDKDTSTPSAEITKTKNRNKSADAA